ncbi:hypothetical protein EV426DRAFT_286990 [Tirmania nivea]|nr:hypothetical protein EV426DRAFT_286990 [Tirmania nivea]
MRSLSSISGFVTLFPFSDLDKGGWYLWIHVAGSVRFLSYVIVYTYLIVVAVQYVWIVSVNPIHLIPFMSLVVAMVFSYRRVYIFVSRIPASGSRSL